MKDRFEGLVDHMLGGGFFLEEAIELLEKTMIQRALEHTAGNRSAASKLLGIHRNTLQSKMQAYALGNGRRVRRKPARREMQVRKRKSAS